MLCSVRHILNQRRMKMKAILTIARKCVAFSQSASPVGDAPLATQSSVRSHFALRRASCQIPAAVLRRGIFTASISGSNWPGSWCCPAERRAASGLPLAQSVAVEFGLQMLQNPVKGAVCSPAPKASVGGRQGAVALAGPARSPRSRAPRRCH